MGSSPIICGNKDSITVSSWFTATKFQDTLVSVIRCDGNFTALQFKPADRAFATVWNPTERSVPYQWAGQYDDGQWHYIAAKYKKGSGCRIFMDGKLVAGDSVNTSALAVSSIPAFRLGSSGDKEYFNGSLDEVRVEKNYRTPDWIKLCYESQRPGSTMVTVK